MNHTLLTQDKNILSSKYQLLTTESALANFKDRGFNISSMKYGSKRNGQLNTHGAHVVRLRNDALRIGEDYIEVVVSNSYDGTLPFAVNLGIFRLVCENGMVLGESMFSHKVKHIGAGFQDAVDGALDESLKHIDRLRELVASLKAKTLTFDDKVAFADRVYRERLKDVSRLDTVRTASSLHAKRVEDRGDDLWTVLNLVQEKCLRGGIHYAQLSDKRDQFGNVIDTKLSYRKTQAIYQPKRTLELNKFIFEEATKLVA